MNIRNFLRSDFNAQGIIVHSQSWAGGEGYSYMKKERPDNGFIMITSGKAVYSTPEGGLINAAQGDILFFPKHSNYRVEFYCENGADTAKSLLVNFSAYDMSGEDIVLSDTVELLGRDLRGSIYRIISEMPKLYRENEVLLLKSRFYSFVDEIINSVLRFSANGMANVLRYIENNICSVIGIDELASLCSVSESSFRKEFKSLTGVSPVRYIKQIKVEKAKELLSSSEISVEDVSNFLAFYDKSHFYKVFKEISGMTPMQYKHRMAAEP